jgi:hypothetical protein
VALEPLPFVLAMFVGFVVNLEKTMEFIEKMKSLSTEREKRKNRERGEVYLI